MRTDGECEDNKNECNVYVCFSVLVVFPTSFRKKGSKEGEYPFIGVGGVG